MTSWMLWSALFTVFVALAALGLERAASHIGLARRFVWIGAMVAALVVPAVIALRVAPLASVPVVEPAVVDRVAAPATTGTPGTAVGEQPSTTWWHSLDVTADRWIGITWLGAAILYSALLFRAVMRLRRRRASWHDIEIGAERVLVSDDDGPAVVGVVHPRIVIPRWALAAERETRALLLLHEREHLRAHDSRVLFGAAVLLAIVPWNAALWWMSRRLRLAIEIDCDARVIRASGARHSYGHMLITVGERYVAPALHASAFLSEPGTHLEARIDAMTTPSARRPLLAALPFAFASAFILGAAAWTPLPAPFRTAPQAPMLPTRRDTVQQDTPARRQFDALFAAFNSPDATKLDEFNKRYMRLDPVRDPTGEKGSNGLAQYRRETGGFDILSIRRSQQTSLEFVARERGGNKATHVGYFAIVAADNPRVESFRMLLVKDGSSVDDPALISHLQNMRP